jgi:signal transduction histidine kinase/ActR/RegA family two-component response regulator
LLIAERRSEMLSLGVSVLILVSSFAMWMLLFLRVRRAHRLLLAESAQRTQAEAGLRQAQKMEAVGRMANGIAHDFNNILSAVRGFANLARSRLGDGHPAEQPLMRIEDAVAQANDVVRGLLALSRNTPSHKVPTELGAVVSDTAKLIRGLLPARIQLAIDVHPEQPVWVTGDRSQLQQVVLNLAVNSRDAIHGEGRILITAGRIADTEGSADAVARLEVSDTGEGIPPEMAEHIFEPFFSTRPREQGSGLGLAVVHGIVTDHGGRIQVRSDPGQGTTMAIDLPAIDPPPEASVELTSPYVHESRSQGMVLVADDHRQIRDIIVETLEVAGFDVVPAADGNELLRMLDRHRNQVRLLVIDYDLPARSGLECVRTVRQEGAPLPIIMITGAAADGLEDALAGEALLLRKPFAMADLVRIARRMASVGDASGDP